MERDNHASEAGRRTCVAAALVLIALYGFGMSMAVAHRFAFASGKGVRNHLINILRIEHALSQGPAVSDIPGIFMSSEIKYPPLLYVLTLPFRAVLPIQDNRIASLTVMLPFFMVFCAGFYMMLRAHLPSRWAILGTLLATANPVLIVSARLYSHVFPCTAWLVLCLGLLSRERILTMRLQSFLFGLVFGLGSLIYYAMPIYAGPAVLVAVLIRWRRSPMRIGYRVQALAWFCAGAIPVAAVYYLNPTALSWFDLRADIFFRNDGPASAGQAGSELYRPLTWLWIYVKYLLTSLWFWAFPLAYLVLALGRRMLRPTQSGAMIWATVLSSLGFFTLLGSKYLAYVKPLAPLLAYAVCLALYAPVFRQRRLAVALISLAMISMGPMALFKIPALNQTKIDTIFNEIVSACDGREPKCKVLTADCRGYFGNWFFWVRRGVYPNRDWILQPKRADAGGAPANDIDFIVAPVQWERSLVDIRIYPKRQCWITYKADSATKDIRLIYWGRDITDLFVETKQVDAGPISMMLFERRDLWENKGRR